MHTANRPDWQQRETPLFQITDYWNDAYNDGVVVHAQANTVDAEDFLTWVNEDRVPLHVVLRKTPPIAKGRLAERGIRLREINSAVADIVGTPAYPLRRVLPTDVADVMPIFKRAFIAKTPGLMEGDQDEITAQFNPLLNLVTLDGRHIGEADGVSLADTVASALGQASLGAIIDISLRSGQSGFHYQYGYRWRQGGELYGGMLQKAAAQKIAALVRKRLGFTAAGQPEDDPVLESYRKPEGYYYEDGMAIALDLINQSAGMRPDRPGIFEYIWEFAKSGRQVAPREELANIVKYATDNKLPLEDLEAAPVAFEGLPLTLLHKVEEACGIEASKRPSSLFRERGVVSTD